MPPFTLDWVAPETEMLLIPTLSLTTAVNRTVWVLADVFKSTLVSSAENEVILGFWSSLLLILTVIVLLVEVFPAASLTVNVGVCVWEP